MSIILMALILAVLAYALGFLQGGRFGWKSATLNAVKEYDSVYQEHEMRIAAANKNECAVRNLEAIASGHLDSFSFADLPEKPANNRLRLDAAKALARIGDE